MSTSIVAIAVLMTSELMHFAHACTTSMSSINFMRGEGEYMDTRSDIT